MDRDRMKSWKRRLLLGGAMGFAGYLGVVWTGRKLIDRAASSIIHRLMVDSYDENLWEFISASTKVGLQNIVETNLRSQEGKVIKRPLGSPKHFPDFGGIMFNCAQLERLAVDEGTSIDTRVIIGPKAKRPLQIEMPIMISGMAYAFALSAKTKIALAHGSSLAGTATNTGEGPFLPAERKAADKLIIQYNRGQWSKSPEILKQADMIEIHMGQGAAGGLGHYIEDKEIDWKIRLMLGVKWGERVIIHARFPGTQDGSFLQGLVGHLKEVTEGVPLGIKLAPGKYLEADLDIAIKAGVDFVTLDGSQAGSKGSAPILQDDFGLPTVFALVRASRYFEKNNLHDKVSLVISGGIKTPGDVLKCLALGADAVNIGSIALFAMAHTQVLKSMPWEPPPELTWYKGKFQHKLNPKKGAKSLAKFLISVNQEIKEGVAALGKTSIHQVNKDDLFALDSSTAEMVGIPLGYQEIPVPPLKEGPFRGS